MANVELRTDINSPEKLIEYLCGCGTNEGVAKAMVNSAVISKGVDLSKGIEKSLLEQLEDTLLAAQGHKQAPRLMSAAQNNDSNAIVEAGSEMVQDINTQKQNPLGFPPDLLVRMGAQKMYLGADLAGALSGFLKAGYDKQDKKETADFLLHVSSSMKQKGDAISAILNPKVIEALADTISDYSHEDTYYVVSEFTKGVIDRSKSRVSTFDDASEQDITTIEAICSEAAENALQFTSEVTTYLERLKEQ